MTETSSEPQEETSIGDDEGELKRQYQLLYTLAGTVLLDDHCFFTQLQRGERLFALWANR